MTIFYRWFWMILATIGFPRLAVWGQRAIQLSVSGVTGAFSKATARRDAGGSGPLACMVRAVPMSVDGQTKSCFGCDEKTKENQNECRCHTCGAKNKTSHVFLDTPFQLVICKNHCFQSPFPGWRLVCLLSSLCGPQLCVGA